MPHVAYIPKTPGWRKFNTNAQAAVGLQGLAGIVPDGAVVTYQGQWVMSGMQAPENTIAAVTAALAADGLHVVASSSDASAWSNQFIGRPYNVKLTVQIANGMGFGDPADVRSIVDHEAYVATEAMPNSSAITSVLAPSSQGSGVTPPGSVSQLPDPNQPEDWSSWLQSNALWIGLGIGAAVLLPKIL